MVPILAEVEADIEEMLGPSSKKCDCHHEFPRPFVISHLATRNDRATEPLG